MKKRHAKRRDFHARDTFGVPAYDIVLGDQMAPYLTNPLAAMMQTQQEREMAEYLEEEAAANAHALLQWATDEERARAYLASHARIPTKRKAIRWAILKQFLYSIADRLASPLKRARAVERLVSWRNSR